MTVESPRNLMSEDKLAWSLIGIAVRQAYLLRLDRAAFRDSGDKEPTERAEQHRIIWNCK
jgi:hypothetical protein